MPPLFIFNEQKIKYLEQRKENRAIIRHNVFKDNIVVGKTLLEPEDTTFAALLAIYTTQQAGANAAAGNE